MSDDKTNTFIFVLWAAARSFEQQIIKEIEKRLKIVRSFEVTWPKRYFARNLASFYGWKSWHVWWNKARKCGTGPFLVIVVEDPNPVWKKERDTYGHVMVVDENVYQLKKTFRTLTGRSNIVHSSVTLDETAHQLAALAAPCDSPIPFRRMCYSDDESLRAQRRDVWLGFLVDLFIPSLMAVAAGGIAWLELFMSKPGCARGYLAAGTGVALSIFSGALLVACMLCRKAGRGAYALFAAFFFGLAVRKADFILAKVFIAHMWPWLLAAITAAFAAVALRYAKTVYSGLREICRDSRHFSLFACGASLVVFASLLFGCPKMWMSPDGHVSSDLTGLARESVELFGQTLMFSWTLSRIYRIRHNHLASGRENGIIFSQNEQGS